MPRARWTSRRKGSAGGSGEGPGISRTPILRIVLIAIVVRLLSAALAFGANVVFPLDQKEQFTVFGRTHQFWDTFARWDSGWYVGIARDGYRWVEGGRSNLAFFPAYPIAMRCAGHALGGRTQHFFLGGVLVSWLAFIGAMLMLWRLARLDLSDADADRAVLLAATFPFAFFFGMAYSESLYLLLMVSTMWAVRSRRWVIAAMVGALAVVSRVNAVLALPALAWMAWVSAARDRHHLISAALALAAMVAGFGAWCGYVYMLSGNPLEWMVAITRWNYHPGGAPWTPLFGLIQALLTRPYQFLSTEAIAPYDTLNGLSALALTATVPFVWARLGAGYGLFMLANLALPLSAGTFEGLGRYCSVLFPFSIWLAAAVRGPLANGLLLYTFGAFYLLAMALFVTVHPLF
jgi:hypothetical protein